MNVVSRYYEIETMLDMIDDERNRNACLKILRENLKLFQTIPGSSHNHQAWPGGYLDHVQETMNIARVLYRKLNSLRPLPFSLSDALLVLFLHDIEKPWKYEIGPDGRRRIVESLKSKEAQHQFRANRLLAYGVVLTSKQENGLKYVEGEFNDYSSDGRVMNPLAAFCHLCDVTSARIWFDYPMEQNDSWSGASRIRDSADKTDWFKRVREKVNWFVIDDLNKKGK